MTEEGGRTGKGPAAGGRCAARAGAVEGGRAAGEGWHFAQGGRTAEEGLHCAERAAAGEDSELRGQAGSSASRPGDGMR